MQNNPDDLLRPNKQFLKQINILLTIILFIMVAGFFTWSENVNITRVIKVIGRLGMTIWIIVIHYKIINKGAIGGFRWVNQVSPFLYFSYLILGFISFLWSTDVGYSALQWFMDLESLVFSFYYVKSLMLLETYFPGNDIRFYNLMGNVAFMLLAIFVIGMVVDPDTYFRLVEGGEDRRLGGYIMNPNELGMLCGLGVSCLIFDLYRFKKKAWTIIKIAIMVYVLILTKSRSSLVGLLIIVFFHVRRLNSKLIIYGIYAAVIAAIPVAVEKLILRKGGIDDILSMTGRMPFWKALISEGLPREPLLGFGFMRIDYKDKFESVHTYAGHMTHNTFMQVLMNLGFVGLCLVLVQLVFTFRGFLREEQEKKLMLLGIIIPVLINSFTEFGIFGETNYGILFFQMLIFIISLRPPLRLTPAEKFYLLKKRSRLSSDKFSHA
ncbi:O-antigen ligase family protein [Chitinophaga sancti]|uniref:O-antigen ligase family protein n=1 Tax=Chitinophaga sancti TaxID=1004 RepID=UPI003F7A1002